MSSNLICTRLSEDICCAIFSVPTIEPPLESATFRWGSLLCGWYVIGRFPSQDMWGSYIWGQLSQTRAQAQLAKRFFSSAVLECGSAPSNLLQIPTSVLEKISEPMRSRVVSSVRLSCGHPQKNRHVFR